jgi:hypothetical protein
MPRNFATLGPSELQPPFTGDYSSNKNIKTFTLTALSRRQSLYNIFRFSNDRTVRRAIIESIIITVICNGIQEKTNEIANKLPKHTLIKNKEKSEKSGM